MNLSVTGHRSVSVADVAKVWATISRLIAKNADVKRITFGGAEGADTEALLAADHARKKHGRTDVALHVVVPCRIQDQPLIAQNSFKLADDIVEMLLPWTLRSRYALRDKELVNRCDQLVAFWSGRSSGTGMTVRMAKEASKPVIHVPVSGKKDK